MSPRQTNVSIFSGAMDKRPGSPTSSTRGDSSFSPDTVDRVFPIRSVVSVDSNATPMPRADGEDHFPGMNLGLEGGLAARRGISRKDSRMRSKSPTSRRSPSRTRKSPEQQNSTADPVPEAYIGHVNNYAGESGRSSEMPRATLGVGNAQSLNHLMSDSASVKSDRTSSTDAGVSIHSSVNSLGQSSQGEGGLVTARFKHVVVDGGHAVITGRGGETLQRCEDEPIAIPGAIQSFGMLLAFREEDEKLVVRVVSENSRKIIGYSPKELFALDSFLDVLSEEQADNLLDHLDFIRDEDAADVASNGPEVFMLSIRPPHKRTLKLWCAMHINNVNRDLVICEFEIEDDHVNPLVPLGDSTPEPPADTLGSQPTPEELAESTVRASKPLRVLRSARKKRGEAAAMEVFNIMTQVQEQLANASTLQTFLRVLIGVIKELTGFHRVMVYQFDHAWNGRVVAELIDQRATKDLYMGLNFPASDIPKQARDLYKLNKVRLLYDRDHETARLVCRTIEDLETPLDLTFSYLRAMSPIHIKYLANMAVRASMSISINAFNELWGLIACHAYGSKGMRVSFPIRKMCRLVGDTASRNIERLSYASRLQARKLINTAPTASNPSGYIVASSEDLLTLFNADVGALSIRDETKILGKSQHQLPEILAMVEFLRLRKISSVHATQDIATDFPDLRYEPGLRFLAGMLFVPLSSGGNDFMAFFRKGVLREVKWAGNPYEKFVKEGTEGYLEPRKSFRTWSETIVGRCRDWSEEEIETAAVLCLVYGKFIDVWRQKEAALQGSQLTRLLLANSAHEVRTPLNAIINYLEIALEGSLDQDTRDNLAKSHSASKSLVYVINDLLDLTQMEDGKVLVKDEVFELNHTLKEATDPFSGDAKRKNIEYNVTIWDGLPHQVVGDHRRVRQVVSNLVANAIQHTSEGSVKVDVWPSETQPALDRVEIEVAVEDTGAGMSQEKVDELFRELEEVSYEGDDIELEMIDQDPFKDKSKEDKTNKTALGLGLAVVARTIRNMSGQLRLKSEEGKGSRFVIQVGFEIAGLPLLPENREEVEKHSLLAPRSGPTTPSVVEGEIMLVNRSAGKRRDSPSLRRKVSKESMNSMISNKSRTSLNSIKSGTSQKSDVDRMIDAIQEPHMQTDDEHRLQNRSSRGRVSRPTSAHQESLELSPSRTKAKSIDSAMVRDLKSSFAKIPGQERVKDSGMPIKPVRLPGDKTLSPSRASRPHGKVMFDVPDMPMVEEPKEEPLSANALSILVAEDDPINSRIIKKRLEKLGHKVHCTVNGEDCATAHGEGAASFDAVLMDLQVCLLLASTLSYADHFHQMPIVDGFSSTKMIRSFEKTHSTTCLSRRARLNSRIPVFAVSASLVEKEKQKYVDTGFDGWILKPVDFKRVGLLLKGIIDDEARNECLYRPGKWEQGGWFEDRPSQPDVHDTDTRPSNEPPTSLPPPVSFPRADTV
jgi:light-regulated signal transduction histidine kinase (bacteriophytochrome)/DNA-binding response OmpR family regulator